jgi:hypothetical protein
MGVECNIRFWHALLVFNFFMHNWGLNAEPNKIKIPWSTIRLLYSANKSGSLHKYQRNNVKCVLRQVMKFHTYNTKQFKWWTISLFLYIPNFTSLILACFGVCVWLLDGVWIGWLDLLTPYTHHSELQAITALFLFHTVSLFSLFIPWK